MNAPTSTHRGCWRESLRWRHRGTFLAAWEEVARVEMNCVTLRPGFRRYSARLMDGAHRRV